MTSPVRTARRWTVELERRRVDGSSWVVEVHEFTGTAGGPTTAIVAGLIGDKPLGALAAHEVCRRLERAPDLAGTVLVIPVLNPFGFQLGARHNPDLIELNRRFPGKPTGFITDQLAYALYTALVDRVDVLVDLHSGTPSRALAYTYDYGDVELSASFGYLPVVLDRAVPGQLCTALVAAGKRALLAEFGGASLDDATAGVEGCLNVLRYLGQLDGAPTGPSEVPVIEHVKLFLPSYEGVLVSPYAPSHVGRPVEPGVVAAVHDIVTNEPREVFEVEPIGATTGTGPGFDVWGPALERPFTVDRRPLLMVANAVPSMIHAGDFGGAVGWATRHVRPFAGRGEGGGT